MQTRLTKDQKQAIGLLSIGTFLEYFDLMLYVHMAVLLNDLFFPKTDPHTTYLISAFTFCATYVLRPFGAIIFGYIGDNYGRKNTVIITTAMMAISCFIIFTLPTYAEIGIAASWGIIFCRILQGMSSMGELVGAEVYLTETIKPPMQYTAIGLLTVFCNLGTATALGVASLILTYNGNWRLAFLFGMVIAIIGFRARTSLRETPEFADAKRRLLNKVNKVATINDNLLPSMVQEKATTKTWVAWFLIQCFFPVCFYFAYIYSGDTLKNAFDYSAQEIIKHNFLLAVIHLICCAILTFLTLKLHPFKITKILLTILITAIILSSFLLPMINSPLQLLAAQGIVMLVSFCDIPIYSICISYFPIFKRFSYAALAFAISRVVVYVATSFGLVYLVKYFGSLGITVMFSIVTTGLIFGIRHFETLESKKVEVEE